MIPRINFKSEVALSIIHRAGSMEESEGVLLDVGGMKCGGCSAAVKRILGARPEVDNLAVNLLTESALVRVKAGTTMTRAQLAQDYADILTEKVQEIPPCSQGKYSQGCHTCT